MVVLVASKNDEDPFCHYKFMGIFPEAQGQLTNSTVLGPIWLKFELVRDDMNVLVTLKNQEDPIKNEDVRVLTTFSPL